MTDKAKPKADSPTHLRVAARRDGYRRCGRAWPLAGVEVPLAELSDDTVSRLSADPGLTVEWVRRP